MDVVEFAAKNNIADRFRSEDTKTIFYLTVKCIKWQVLNEVWCSTYSTTDIYCFYIKKRLLHGSPLYSEMSFRRQLDDKENKE